MDKLICTVKRSVFAYKGRFWGGILAIIFGAIGLSVTLFGLVFIGFGILLIACAYVSASHFSIKIYDDKIISREGLISTNERRATMTPIIGISVSQGLFGKIFNYGNIVIDKVGRGWDIKTSYVKSPYAVKRSLENFIQSQKNNDNNKINYFVAN